jgi:catechol 2,3-dioxygenase-like lactoylglutathione lyase family enzyme
MSQPLTSVGVVTLFVEDAKRSKEFYEKVFEVASIFEDENSAVMRFENMLVNILQRSHAGELIEPAPVAASGAGASFMFTIWVENADDACAQLTERGVELLNGPVDRPWGVRTAAFADPDGYAWEVAQQLG